MLATRLHNKIKEARVTEQIRTPALSRRIAFGTGALGAIAAATAGFSLIPQAHAQAATNSKLQEVLKRGKLIVGTGTTNPPWHFEDDSGNLVGMDIDLAKLLAKGLFDDPEKVEFVRQAADARIPNLVTNKIDIVAQFMTITPGRARQVEFTIPYYREGVGLMVIKDSPLKGYADLKAMGDKATIVWMQNVGVEDYTRMVLPDIKVLQVDSPDATFQAINARRADVSASDLSTIRYLVGKFPDRYRDLGFGWLPNSYAFAVAPGDPVWLNWVNGQVREAFLGVDFDYMKAAYKKWFGVDLPIPHTGLPSEYGLT
jgi:polar amino acid transport system substrate-binding protein